MTNQRQLLRKGMYVRVPLDVEEAEGEYRDYRLGQVVRFDELANTERGSGVIIMCSLRGRGGGFVRRICWWLLIVRSLIPTSS